MSIKSKFDFQLSSDVCNYMANLVDSNNPTQTILEPMQGLGGIVNALQGKGDIYTPSDFFNFNHLPKYDWIVMNPPLSPMTQGHLVLDMCMELSDNIVALMPWLTLINGDKRTRKIKNFGLKAITHMPRKTFAGSRIQACIIELEKGYKGETILKFY